MSSKKPTPPMDVQFLHTIGDDLDFLTGLSGSEPSEGDLRRASSTLRRFLVQDDLIRAWRMLGMSPPQPLIVATRLPVTSQGIAFAGGGMRAGIMVAAMTFRRGAATPEEIKANYENSRSGVVDVLQPLAEFCATAAASIDGVRIPRSRLIAYVANKLGGNHYDIRRKSDEQHYKLLDSVNGLFYVGGSDDIPPLPQVHFEILSIAQAITGSSDIRRLREAIGRL